MVKKKNDQELVDSVIKTSILKIVYQVEIPILFKKLLDVQMQHIMLSENPIDVFEIIFDFIKTKNHNFEFNYYLEYFFKNPYFYDKVNDLRVVLKYAINQETGDRIKMFYLLILYNTGLYSFLCSNFWPEDIKEKRIFDMKHNLRQMIKMKDSEMERNVQNVIFDTKYNLKNSIMFFNTIDLKHNLFFKEFLFQFSQEESSKIFYNRTGQYYLRNFGSQENDSIKVNNRIKEKLEIRIHNRVKRLCPLMKENVQMYKDHFFFILLFRDFLSNYSYNQTDFVDVKYMSIQKETNKNNLLLIDTKSMFPAKPKEVVLRSKEIRQFSTKNNEPGGLSFFCQLAAHVFNRSEKKRKRVNLMIMMFGLTLNDSKFQEILRVLDSFSPGSEILYWLVEFIQEKQFSVQDLFVKNGIEHLLISFMLLHFELIAQELTTMQFINFLEGMHDLMKNYYKSSYKFEYFLKEKDTLYGWKTKSELKAQLDQDFCFKNMMKNFKLWIHLMKSAKQRSKFFIENKLN